MLSRTRSSLKRKRRSAGNALLEGALVIIPTFAMIAGFVDFGLMFFRWTTLQNAAREGVRYAVTFQTSGSLGQADSIRQVVQTNAMGLVRASDTPQSIIVKYYKQATPNVEVTTNGNSPGNIVEIHIQSPLYSWILSGPGALRTQGPMRFNVYAYDILGALPLGVNSVAP
jgi:Flp pilus assembly protein TadG